MPPKNFQHVSTVDPKKEWANGLGFFLRISGIVTSAIVAVLKSAAVWRFVGVEYGLCALIVSLAGIGWLCFYRHQTLRRIQTDDSLHNLLHGTRDDMVPIIQSEDSGRVDQLIDGFHRNTANRIAGYFQCRLNNTRVGCAIRVAEELDGNKCYVTYARSSGLDARASTTEPLRADAGLAMSLRNKESRGVFIVNDVKTAIDDGQWEKLRNDENSEIQSVMVVPINSLEDGVSAMVGILYVTSDSPVFLVRHTSAAKAFADLLGFVFPILFSHQLDVARPGKVIK